MPVTVAADFGKIFGPTVVNSPEEIFYLKMTRLDQQGMYLAMFAHHPGAKLHGTGGFFTPVYGALGDLYTGPAPLIVSDFSADQVYPRPVVARDTYTLFSYDPEYSAVRSFNRANESPLHIWQQSYSGIERANLVIANVPAILMNPTRRDEIVAEARFLRAFFYWTLTKNFGDVVLKTEPSTSEAAAVAPKSTR